MQSTAASDQKKWLAAIMTRPLALLKWSLIALLILGLTCFLRKTTAFEDGIYQKYAISMVEDLDFNIFNQFSDSSHTWMITKTGNHPDFHHEAVGAILTPFYFILKFLNTAEDWKHSAPIVNAMVTVFFFLFSVLLWQKYFFQKEKKFSLYLILILLFVTPMGVNLLLQPEEVGIIIMYFVSVFFVIADKSLQGKNLNFWQSILLGFVCVLKTETIFLFPLGLFLTLRASESQKQRFLNTMGLLAFPFVFLVNSEIKFGQPSYLIQTIFQNNYLYFLDSIFGINGLFFFSPLYFLGLCLLAIDFRQTKNALNDKVLNYGFFILVAIGLVVAQVPLKHIPDLLDRHFVPFTMVLLYLVIALQQKMESFTPVWRKSLKFVFWISLLWTVYLKCYYAFESIASNSNFEPLFLKGVTFFTDLWRYGSQRWPLFKEEILNSNYIGILACALLLRGLFWLELRSNRIGWTCYAIFAACYFGFSSCNLIMNPKNVERMQSAGLFQNAVICEGEICIYDDIMDVFANGIEQYSQAGNFQRASAIKLQREKFLSENVEKIKSDPVGFVANCKKGIFRKSFWQK